MRKYNNDIDSICNDIYKCVPGDRTKFNSIMTRLENDFLKEISNDNNNYISPFNQIVNHNQDYLMQVSYNSKHQNNASHKRNNTNLNKHKTPIIKYNNCFDRTAPDSEMLCYKPFETKRRSKLSDLNANCKYYHPEIYDGTNEMGLMKDMQWTDRTNNICLLCKIDSSSLRRNQKDKSKYTGNSSQNSNITQSKSYVQSSQSGTRRI